MSKEIDNNELNKKLDTLMEIVGELKKENTELKKKVEKGVPTRKEMDVTPAPLDNESRGLIAIEYLVNTIDYKAGQRIALPKKIALKLIADGKVKRQ